MNKVMLWLLAVALVAGGLFLWDRKQDRDDCEQRALAAAIDTYPIDEYPNAAERDRLQATYTQTYLERCGS